MQFHGCLGPPPAVSDVIPSLRTIRVYGFEFFQTLFSPSATRSRLNCRSCTTLCIAPLNVVRGQCQPREPSASRTSPREEGCATSKNAGLKPAATKPGCDVVLRGMKAKRVTPLLNVSDM